MAVSAMRCVTSRAHRRRATTQAADGDAVVTYHNLTDNDLKAIYAYLSSLPQAKGCNTPADGCAGPPAFPNATPPTPAIGSGPALGLASGRYAYHDDPQLPGACPNPPPQ